MNISEKITLLIVDDVPNNLILLGSLLKDEYEIKVANNGQNALEIAQSNPPPDLILLDVVMPDIDGYEVCRRLKENEITKHIPVIFLTAKLGIDDEAKGLALGAIDYLVKPIVPLVVKSRIHAHLSTKKMNDALYSKVSHTQKIESIVQLTAGVAHEFNNILGCMLGYNEMNEWISEDMTDDNLKSDLAKNTKQIDIAGKRAAALIEKMLIYCRQDTTKENIVIRPIAAIIDDILAELRHRLPNQIEIKVQLNSKQEIQIDAGDLHQILTNLIENSISAMKASGGVMTISSEIVEGLNHHCSACAATIKGDFIELSVSDEGHGIESNVIKKIFDPFFTTKEVGEGTGLGLSTVSGMVHNYSGHILVDSKQGQGAKFKLVFPILIDATDDKN